MFVLPLELLFSSHGLLILLLLSSCRDLWLETLGLDSLLELCLKTCGLDISLGQGLLQGVLFGIGMSLFTKSQLSLTLHEVVVLELFLLKKSSEHVTSTKLTGTVLTLTKLTLFTRVPGTDSKPSGLGGNAARSPAPCPFPGQRCPFCLLFCHDKWLNSSSLHLIFAFQVLYAVICSFLVPPLLNLEWQICYSTHANYFHLHLWL